jgi:glycosyltransferase involved in cell wall biosynthesis
MRIAINAWFWDSPTTGSGQYTRRFVESLTDLDADLQIVLVVPSGGGGTADRRPGPDAASPCVLYPVPGSRSDLGKVRFEQLAFPRACARVGAHVAHVPYWAPPARSPVPLVVTIHDLIPLVLPGPQGRHRGGPLQRFYTALVSATARGASVVLTDSEASRRDILSQLTLPPRRVRVIPLGVDERYDPRPAPEDAAVRAAYDLPERYVLYLGSFHRRKNLATVLETYRWVGLAVGDECPLVIAGKLPTKSQTQLEHSQRSATTPDPRWLMREAGVPERFVHFSGFVDEADKPAFYRGALAFIFPSRYEGFGLPPLEAMACGTPVVGSDAASLPEIVGDAGILLPPDDAEGMAGALIHLVSDEGFRTEMGRRALAQAARFSWERTARATLAAYDAAQAIKR